MSSGRLWAAVQAGVDAGCDELNRRLESLRDEAGRDLAERMSTEMGYLRSQIRRGTTNEKATAERSLHLRNKLLESVRRAEIEVEGVALIIGC